MMLQLLQSSTSASIQLPEVPMMAEVYYGGGASEFRYRLCLREFLRPVGERLALRERSDAAFHVDYLRWYAMSLSCPAPRANDWEDLRIGTAMSSASVGSARPALRRLAELADLGPNWNSYGAAPISGHAIAAARGVMDTVHELFSDWAGQRVEPDVIAPLADGGLQLEWRGSHAELEAEIGPAGDIGYLLIDRKGAIPAYSQGDAISLVELLDLIAQVLVFPVKD